MLACTWCSHSKHISYSVLPPQKTFQIIAMYSMRVPYSGNFSRTINFAVFMDFTATSKINPLKSYSIQMQ